MLNVRFSYWTQWTFYIAPVLASPHITNDNLLNNPMISLIYLLCLFILVHTSSDDPGKCAAHCFQMTLIAERISDHQIIVQQVLHYSRVLVCMYISTKICRLWVCNLIVLLIVRCLSFVYYIYIRIFSCVFHISYLRGNWSVTVPVRQ